MANLPEITYRFPTIASGPQSDPTPSIIFDWSVDITSTQFSDDAQRAKNLVLMEENTSTIIPTDFVSYTAQTRRVEVVPASSLTPNSIYRILIKSKIQSTDGRKSFNEYHWTFQTASGSVNPEISLLAPGDATVQPAGPVLQWSAVSFTASAATGAVSYTVHLSERFDFSSLNYDTTTTSLSAAPNYSSFIQENTTYYWRVLAHTVGATGNWSETWSFYYGRVIPSDINNRQFFPDVDTFEVKKVGFKQGLSNQSAFPTISLRFNSIPVSSYSSFINVTRKSVLPRNDDEDSYLEVAVSGTWTQTSSTLVFVPTEEIINNTRYEIRILPELTNTTGYEIGDEYSFWFTSKYSPFYVSPRTIRARFLGAEQQVPDDLINFYIYQASLEANARYWGYTSSVEYVADSLEEPVVRDSSNLTSFGVLKWTESAASYKILKAILFENLRDIGRTERLGDSLVSLTKDFIAGIDKALEIVAQELEQWESYLAPSSYPISVSKSSRWTPCEWNSDWSIMRLEARRDDYF